MGAGRYFTLSVVPWGWLSGPPLVGLLEGFTFPGPQTSVRFGPWRTILEVFTLKLGLLSPLDPILALDLWLLPDDQ